MKWGWCGNTIDANQLDSGKVIRPPSPGTLPVRSPMSRKNVGSCRVVVKESHFDSSIWSVKLAGWPNCGRPAAIFSQRAQEPPSDFPCSAGARVHRAQTGSLGHRSQGDDHFVFLAHLYRILVAVMITQNLRHGVTLGILVEIKTGDAGVQSQTSRPALQPLLQRPHHRVILVVDGSHNPA